VAFLAVMPEGGQPSAGGDAGTACWVPVDSITDALAFDHRVILDDGLERLRAKLEYSPLAAAFCLGDTFTISDLHRVYETVWGVRLDLRNFHRKISGTTGFVEPTGGKRTSGAGRPAVLYRRAPGLNMWASVLHPPIVSFHATRSVADSFQCGAAKLKPGMTVLDVGCGPGSITRTPSCSPHTARSWRRCYRLNPFRRRASRYVGCGMFWGKCLANTSGK